MKVQRTHVNSLKFARKCYTEARLTMRSLAVLIIAACMLYAGIVVTPVAQAAAPTAGSIGASGPTIAWTGSAVATGAANETVCQEGVNCDTFTLNVLPGDYTNKLISVKIEWTVPANDYDLYIHKDSNSGPIVGSSAGGAPQTSEAASIDPSATGTGVYTVHVLYFAGATAADQYRGTASIASKSVSRTATYVKGGMTFSSNVTVKAPSASADGEPSSRTDYQGNHYVGAIRGVPAGVDLWYFDLRRSEEHTSELQSH